MRDERSVDSSMTLVVVLALVIAFVGGALYLLHSSGQAVSENIRRHDAAPPAPLPGESEGTSAASAPPSDTASETSITFQEGPAARVNDLNSQMSGNLHKVKTYFKPASSEQDAPVAHTAGQAERYFEHAPAPTENVSDDEAEPGVMAWKSPPPGIHPAPGDVVEIHVADRAPRRVIVTEIMREGDKNYWLVKVASDDLEFMQEVVNGAPERLKARIVR